MRFYLIAVRKRLPAWVDAGFHEYAKRLPAECRLELIAIPPARRRKSSVMARLLQEEAKRILAAIPTGAKVVALAETGEQWSCRELADHMHAWMRASPDVALLVGGADGLDGALTESADYTWSLSRLTLPHALVSIIVVEQLYRAWTMLIKHPYHRA
ncbi:MAG: 23S rRNA (pseudouridine(1915)-N(3))-methyltransferase RlmH [Gammaproteobacteria bacterium]|nr:23S rRNA (pseudouridine(1915)-N(3))-methyltransferase RlmH [Gammaproteobacteria bacterium]